MKVLFVGGDFNDEGGRPSGYFYKFVESICKLIGTNGVVVENGGTFSKLEALVQATDAIQRADVVFWFASVPNDKPKLIRDVKKLNPTCMLVTSKYNPSGEYGFQQLVGRALENKANLLVEFQKKLFVDEGELVVGRVLDPLGNCFNGEGESYVDLLATTIVGRLTELKSYTRMGSKQDIDEALPVPTDQKCFYGLINKCADKFHELIHGANTERMLGNASFRCESGFPSMRQGDLIYVSKRNIDKRDIGAEGFVACEAHSPVFNNSVVRYAGDHKPSVDSPVQLALYSYYKNINYMIHSHVYVDGAPFTSEKIPCGALEEARAILNVYPWRDIEHFAINLKGHGSIICGEAVFELERYTDKYIARPMPEM